MLLIILQLCDALFDIIQGTMAFLFNHAGGNSWVPINERLVYKGNSGDLKPRYHLFVSSLTVLTSNRMNTKQKSAISMRFGQVVTELLLYQLSDSEENLLFLAFPFPGTACQHVPSFQPRVLRREGYAFSRTPRFDFLHLPW